MSRPWRLLIVEDMEVYARFVKLRLESLGYEVLGIAMDGPTAVAEALDKKPDLIIMDISLKTSMTGIEAAREILNQSRIPIIFLTGNTDKEVLKEGEEISDSEVFLKPFSEQELHVAIQQAIISNAMNRYVD